MKKRFTCCASILIIMFTVVCIIINIGSCADVNDTPKPSNPPEEPSPEPTAVPTAVPPPTPIPTSVPRNPGEVWLIPENQEVSNGASFTTEVHCHTGLQELGAYGIDLYFDSAIIVVDTLVGDESGVDEGPDGFIAAINPNDDGVLKTSGFDTGGTGPGSDLHILTIHWKAIGRGTSSINIDVRNMTDPDTEDIGTLNGISGSVTVN
jgi:hypothetical protein